MKPHTLILTDENKSVFLIRVCGSVGSLTLLFMGSIHLPKLYKVFTGCKIPCFGCRYQLPFCLSSTYIDYINVLKFFTKYFCFIDTLVDFSKYIL